MSIYVTGDTHGALGRFSERFMPGIDTWTKEDVIIICGDFGFLLEDNALEAWKLDQLEKFPFSICFLDGNHENFPKMETFEREIRYDRPVNRIRNNVFWLRRGELYTIQGYTFWVFGGGYSLDKARRLEYERLSGVKVWFDEELPKAEDYKRGADTLKACNYEVDFILTHSAPSNMVYRLLKAQPDPHEVELDGFLDWAYHSVKFRHWYAGHFHEDIKMNEQFTFCYQDVYCIT